MKKLFFQLIAAILLSGVPFVLHAQDRAEIPIAIEDISENATVNKNIDFTKNFRIIFTGNRESENFELLLSDPIKKVLHKKITPDEEDRFTVEFTTNNNVLTVKDVNNAPVNINTSFTLQYKSSDKSFFLKIMHEAGSSATGAGNTNTKKDVSANNFTQIGIEVHDAILAYRFYTQGKKDSLLQMLAALKGISVDINYKAPISTEQNKKNEAGEKIVKNAYQNNPFITSIISASVHSFKAPEISLASIQGGTSKGFLASALSKAGGLDVTTIADGLARFLVKRAKEELSVAFFQKFKDEINSPEYKDAQILFPKTMETLNAIDQDIYRLENYIESLRESFEKDLASMLDNLPTVVEEGRFSDYFTAHPNLKSSVLLSLFTGRELLNGSHPGKIIANFPDEYIDGFSNENARGSIQTIQVLSASIRAHGGSRYWTTLDTLKMLITRQDSSLITARLYLGFVYENSKGIKFANGQELRGYLNELSNNTDSIKAYISFVQKLSQNCQNVEDAARQIAEKKGDSSKLALYTRFFNATADVIEQANKVSTLPYIKINGKIPEDVTKYLTVFRQATDLALNIGHRNYGAAANNVYNIYLRLTEKRKLERDPITTNTNLTAKPFPGDEPTTLKGEKNDNSNSVKKLNNIVIKTANFIMRYGNMMSNVVRAKTSEEAAKAIEAAVLPVGSYSLKRKSKLNISLNAYPGLFVGHEKIKGVDTAFKPNSFGVTAPIGIAISTGLGRNSKSSSSLSLFVSLIDLGAPVSFRFKDDKAESVPTIQLKDIFSPGVFLSVGIPRTPLALGVGWQIGPVLRKLDASVASKAASNYSRVSVTLAVDIPLLNFSNNQ